MKSWVQTAIGRRQEEAGGLNVCRKTVTGKKSDCFVMKIRSGNITELGAGTQGKVWLFVEGAVLFVP